VYSPSRAYDFTPPTDPSPEGFGGAQSFLEFIETVVRPSVWERFPNIKAGREALFGHSYGGLFALYVLFAKDCLFDCVIASSPSMEYGNDFILTREQAFRAETPKPDSKLPTLMLFFGSLEHTVVQWHDELDEAFAQRQKVVAARKMSSNVRGLWERLKVSNRLRSVTLAEYEGEDHGTVMACALSRSLTSFFEEWSP
jgi:predicted alpha/beta superfamily hydrolase